MNYSGVFKTEPTKIEKEIIILKGVSELIDSLVNNQVLQFCDFPDITSMMVQFKTPIHQKYFTTILSDFLSKTDASFDLGKIEFLDAIILLCKEPCFGKNEDSENLKKSVQNFRDWLDGTPSILVWSPSLGKEFFLKMKRATFLKICGNLSKHNFLRLGGVAKEMIREFKNNDIELDIDEAVMLFGDFYQRYHEDIIIYHASTISEFLNNLRWSIYEYLLPEYERSYVRKEDHPTSYEFQYPIGVTLPLAKECYWELMNDVRRRPYVEKFRVDEIMKKRY